MPLWKQLPRLLQPETADREESLVPQHAGELHAGLPASHRSSQHESNADTPVLTATENAAACVKQKKRSNLTAEVFVNHLHLRSISQCILYIQTHKNVTILFSFMSIQDVCQQLADSNFK